MTSIAHLATAVAAAALALPAAAQFAKPEDAVKYRQSALFVMSQHFARIGAMATDKAPYDAKAAVENAEIVAEMAKLPWAGFVPGTDSIGNTRAKRETGPSRPASRSTTRSWWARPRSCSPPPGPTTWTT